MIADAITKVSELAKQAAEATHKASLPHYIATPDPHKRLLVSGETHSEVSVPPSPRAHKVDSVDQIPEILKTSGEVWAMPDVTVWFNDSVVQAVLDDGGYRESVVKCAITHTDEWKWLTDSATNLQPKEIIKALRTILRDSLPKDEMAELITTLRTIKFATGATITTNVRHGGESIGSDILGDVQSLYKEIPEEIRFKVRVYDDRALPHLVTLRCAVEIDARAGTIDLLPAESDVIAGVENVLSQLHTLLSEGSTRPVLFGSPTT